MLFFYCNSFIRKEAEEKYFDTKCRSEVLAELKLLLRLVSITPTVK